MKIRWLKGLVLSGFCGMLTACPKEVYLTSERWAPGPLNLTGADTLAVAPIGGEGGRELAAYLDGALQNTPRFRLVDRHYVARLVEEEALLEHLGSGEKSKALLRADILIIGELLQNEFFEDVTYETRTGPDFEDSTLYRRTPIKTIRASFKYVDSRTGWVVATRTYEAQEAGMTDYVRAEGRPDSRSENLESLFLPVDAAALSRCAHLNIASQVFEDVAPHLEKTQVVLEHESSLEESQHALDAAYRGHWDRAVTIYRRLARELDRVSPNNLRFRAAAHFDLGVALGAWGKHDEALHEVDYANHLSPKRLYTRTITRLNKERENSQALPLAINPSLAGHYK